MREGTDAETLPLFSPSSSSLCLHAPRRSAVRTAVTWRERVDLRDKGVSPFKPSYTASQFSTKKKMAALIGLGFVEDAERVLSGEGGRERTTNLVQSLRAWVGVNQTAFPSLTSFDEDDRASAARLLVRLLEATEATEATEGEAPAMAIGSDTCELQAAVLDVIRVIYILPPSSLLALPRAALPITYMLPAWHAYPA